MPGNEAMFCSGITVKRTGIFLVFAGFALMGEGFMSLIYHICPTNRNFQFGE